MEKIKGPEKRLLSDTIQVCIENRLKVILYPKKVHRKCGGWVDENTKEFMCCFDPNGTYSHNWGIFVHESSHVDQLSEESPLWFDPILESYDVDMLSRHTSKGCRKTAKLERYFKKSLELELDCEKRAVEKIKKYKLNLNVEEYIQTGNVYLFSYFCFYHLKCWYDSKFRIYDQEELVNQMPKTYLNLDDYWKKNNLIYNFLEKHNSKK